MTSTVDAVGGAPAPPTAPLVEMLAVTKRYGAVAALGQLVGGAAMLVLASRSGVPAAVAAFWAAYLANALTGSPIATLLNDEVPSSRRSSTLSVVSLAGFVGGLVGSVAFGWLAQRAGIPAVWTVAGAIPSPPPR